VAEKKTVFLTRREKDILDLMFNEAEDVGSNTLRICKPPSDIRNEIEQNYPGLKAFHVTSSQKKLVQFGFLIRLPTIGDREFLSGVKLPSTFEINQALLFGCNIEIIAKRKAGYQPGAQRKPPVTIDKTKTTLKRAKQLVARFKSEIVVLGKRALVARKKVAELDKQLEEKREIVKVVSDLLAVKRKNLKNLGLLPEVE
jgi:hypothetical protein